MSDFLRKIQQIAALKNKYELKSINAVDEWDNGIILVLRNDYDEIFSLVRIVAKVIDKKLNVELEIEGEARWEGGSFEGSFDSEYLQKICNIMKEIRDILK